MHNICLMYVEYVHKSIGLIVNKLNKKKQTSTSLNKDHSWRTGILIIPAGQ